MPEQHKKNILYVENGIGYGGAIICLRHLIRHLDQTRYTAMVVTGRTSPDYQSIATEAYWRHIADRHIDSAELRRKLATIPLLSRCSAGKIISNQLVARLDDMANFLPFFLRLLWTAQRFKADLIHANNEPLCNRAALLVGKILNIPTVCHVRGDQAGSRMMQWAFGLPDHFISVSHWVAATMREKLHVPAEKISVIYDGIALESLDLNANGDEFRQYHQIADTAFVVGLVGLLIPWKGQDIFLDAAKLLRDSIPQLKMLIVGGTPDDCVAYEALLRQRVAAEQLQDTVLFTGHVSAMATVYNGLNIVVSASTSPEPLGTVVIEAMAMGRPLIGPDHGGAAEMMTHKSTGLLFQAGDATALAAAILCLYQQPDLQKKLGDNARIQALATFDVQHHAEKIQAIYQQLIKN
jgi:glycosyltransferase involved in cell wall biosynthesis